MSCTSNLPRNDFTNLIYIQSSNCSLPRDMMNVGRFRKGNNKKICYNSTMTPWFKNSTKNQYLADVPYAVRVGDRIRNGIRQGTTKIRFTKCIDLQFGRVCGTGGRFISNKF